MKIAVLGAGAMGSWFGGQLARHGNDVQLLTTNAAHREAIHAKGLLLRSPDEDHLIQIGAYSPTEMQTPIDLILLFTKAFQTREAMKSIVSCLNDSTHVLSLQNGLGNSEAIADFLPLERVWIGASMMPVDKIAPGIVACKGHGESYFGNAAKQDQQAIAGQILAAFERAGLAITHTDNVHQRIWEKVAFNAGMNAIAALSHGRPKTIGQSHDAVALVRNVAREVAEVARHESVDVDLESVFDMITLSCEKHGDHIPSMLNDLLSRRRTEVDAINGAIVERAAPFGVDVPLNKMLATLLRLAEVSHIAYD